MAVFLVTGLILYGLFYNAGAGLPNTEKGVFGGPIDQNFGPNGITLGMASVFSEAQGASPADFSQDGVLESGVLPGALDDNASASGQSSFRDNLLVYRVQKGDTLSGIASYFGVSLDTIVNANPGVKGKVLTIGDNLNILPTSGSVYITQEGDTLESIADYFNISAGSIKNFNKSVDFNSLGAGVDLVVPGIRAAYAAQNKNSLPNFNANFIKPADGFNWGKLHHYNAVDISNSCGTPVVASAEGLILPDDNFGDGRDGWNGGYGSFVLIEHPFGDSVRTRYAHLSKILVDIGEYVKQGQEIGLMGQTGDATGCHIHFEVYGAQNPFAK